MKKKIHKDYNNLTVGMMFPVSIAVGLAIGYFLDKLFHTDPIFLIIFLCYGIAAGFVNLLKLAKTKKDEK